MATMFITPPEQNHSRSANADWMELHALRSRDRRSTIGDIAGIFDLTDDATTEYAFNGETTDDLHDESILETERNRPIDHMFDELQYRARVLGDAYPFTVETSPPAPSLKSQASRRLPVVSYISSACSLQPFAKIDSNPSN